MYKYLLAATAALAIAAPASARDGALYAGVEGGIMFPRDLNGDAFVDYTIAAPGLPAGVDFGVDNAFDAELKRGWDVDAIVGYDFGGFRLEGELAHKRAKRDGFDLDGGLETTIGTAIGGSVDNEAFDNADGKVTVNSAMVNLLGDFGADDGLGFYAGVGAGRAWARALDDGDKAWAFQAIAGVRSAISENMDIGLKYRYFRTGELNFDGGPLGVGGAARVAQFYPSLNGKFRSHSLLASLIFNFGAPEPEPVVVAAPPPPPPPPATQTCPDGSVILATDMCPAPPPPPPPAPAGERG